MTHVDCTHLDDYLLDQLSPAVTTAFVEHLTRCADCRSQQQAQRELDAALKELGELPQLFADRPKQEWADNLALVLNEPLDRPNSSASRLAATADKGLPSARRGTAWPVVLQRASWVAAASLLVGVILGSWPNDVPRPADGEPTPIIARPAAPEVTVAMFDPSSDAPSISIEVPTRSSNVTLVRVYPVHTREIPPDVDMQLPAHESGWQRRGDETQVTIP